MYLMKRINDGHPLRAFLARLKPTEQVLFASDCGTTVGYLRKLLCRQAMKPDVSLVARISMASKGRVQPADLRPDVDWGLVRKTIRVKRSTTQRGA